MADLAKLHFCLNRLCFIAINSKMSALAERTSVTKDWKVNLTRSSENLTNQTG
jgi:hypothetical protein